MLTDNISHRFCVAPMIDWTDQHFRYLFRLISRHARVYTEMITWQALLYGNSERLLRFDDSEHPVACQLGGSNPMQLGNAAKLVAQYGYDEINLNVGCPSDRVQQGEFGACLMAQPQKVAECVAALRAGCDLPVTIKTRIGIDHNDSLDFLLDFVGPQIEQGVTTVILHARKAWLSGLSPKQNREIPPLDYARAYQLKQHFPAAQIILNGGLADLASIKPHLAVLDGVMVGRACYQHPTRFINLDQQLFNTSQPSRTLWEIIALYQGYMQQQLQKGVRLHTMTRHLLNLFQDQPGARRWRRHLSEQAPKRPHDIQVVTEALQFVRQNSAISNQ